MSLSKLAELTRTVEAMAKDLNAMTECADRQQARADSRQDIVDSQQKRAQVQQERIDLAARELADVSSPARSSRRCRREPPFLLSPATTATGSNPSRLECGALACDPKRIRQDAERLVEARGDDPEIAGYLRIAERASEAGG